MNLTIVVAYDKIRWVASARPLLGDRKDDNSLVRETAEVVEASVMVRGRHLAQIMRNSRL